MNCGFCGYDFDLTEGETNCPGCPLQANCGYVRCPRCGYDSLREAALVTLIRGWAQRLRRPARDPRFGEVGSYDAQ